MEALDELEFLLGLVCVIIAEVKGAGPVITVVEMVGGSVPGVTMVKLILGHANVLPVVVRGNVIQALNVIPVMDQEV